MSRLLNGSRGLVRQSVSRNFGATAVALKELDPIQALFIEKIKEYTQASEAAGTYQNKQKFIMSTFSPRHKICDVM